MVWATDELVLTLLLKGRLSLEVSATGKSQREQRAKCNRNPLHDLHAATPLPFSQLA